MIAIVGPTASGKSDVASFLYKKFGLKIVNFDSCQVYSGLPCLTASPVDLNGHYLYSFCSYEERLNVFKWCELAKSLSENFLANDQNFVFVGGTALYLKFFIEGIDLLPETSGEIISFVEGLSFVEVQIELAKKDPVCLKKYFDERRLRKALGFVLSHGYSIFDAFGKFKKNFCQFPIRVFALLPHKDILLANIKSRLYRDFDDMVLEVSNFQLYADHVIGVMEIKRFLSGKISKEECLQLIEFRTRQYAKRQITFIKNSLNIELFFSDSNLMKEYFLKNF